MCVVAMSLSTSGQWPGEHDGSLKPDGDTERNPRAAPLPIPSFPHMFTVRALPEEKNWNQGVDGSSQQDTGWV